MIADSARLDLLMKGIQKRAENLGKPYLDLLEPSEWAHLLDTIEQTPPAGCEPLPDGWREHVTKAAGRAS